jgi:hypothetical protein
MATETAKFDDSPKPNPQINTYHCICSTLLLATTHDLRLLPRRAEPALDKAYILPLPPASRLAGETGDEEEADPQIRDTSDAGYSLLLSTTQDRKPTIVRREDGFEKRTLLRCGRCRLVVGYKLDPAHLGPMDSGVAGRDTGEGAEGGNEDGGREVVYLLPGSLFSSEDLKNGKAPEAPEWEEWDLTVA